MGFSLRSDGVPSPQIHQREREQLWCTEQASCASLLLQHACAPLRIVPRGTIALIRDVDRGNVWSVLFFHSENCGTNSESQEMNSWTIKAWDGRGCKLQATIGKREQSIKYRKEFESPALPTPCTAHMYSVAIAGFLHARRDGPAPVSTVPVGRVACLGDVSRVRLICGAIEALFSAVRFTSCLRVDA